MPLLRDTATIISAPGQHLSLALADGSQVELNAHTSLHTDFRYGRRHLRLDRGEAFFSVAKDPAHPFLLETPRGTVRVTGTVFNVRLTSGDQPEVTLHEGSVRFETGAVASIALAPGQQLAMDGPAFRVRDLLPTDLENLTAWRKGRLVLDGLTLAEAAGRLAEFNRRNPVQLAVGDPALGAMRLSAAFRSDNVEGFVRLMESDFGMRAEWRSEREIVLRRAK
jgi:transmembrane sensor